MTAVESGNYNFRTVADDGVLLWVDNNLVTDRWTNTSATNTSAPVYLTAGQKVQVRMDHYDNTGTATARLPWLRPGSSTVFTTQLPAVTGTSRITSWGCDSRRPKPE